MKIYKVNWTIISYLRDGSMTAKESALIESYKFTTDKDKANQIVKELEKCAAYLGISRELRTNIKEEDCE